MKEAWMLHSPLEFLKARRDIPAFQANYIHSQATSSQKRVLSDYVDGGESLWINNYLRGVRMDEVPEEGKNVLRAKAKGLNSMIRNAPKSPSSCILFRGISPDLQTQFQDQEQQKKKQFSNKGIVSTSLSYEVAKDFVEGQSCCLLVILVPKGSRMLQVLDQSAWSEEKEVLLPHGNEFVVMKTAVVEGVLTHFCKMKRR